MSDQLRSEYKDCYQREMTRRNELTAAIERPLAIITALLGVLYFCFKDVQPNPAHLYLLQTVGGVAALVCLISAVVQLVRANVGHTYRFLPTPMQLEAYRRELLKYHIDDRKLPQDAIDAKVYDYIFSAYIEAAHDNAIVNDARNARLYRTKHWLVLTLLALVPVLIFRFAGSAPATFWIGQLNKWISAL